MTSPTSNGLAIQREEGDSKGRYVVHLDGAEAELTYSRAGDSMIIIDHTEVPGAMRGS
ncbi:GNAT family N-acetyltransferase [Paracoccus sp. Z118]|uniref:GNAT family N-acetyltransferase n=1 Tax=Paracoccus sp. Z118 TaxID=2851017 RepID=UPI00353009F9